MILVKSAVIVSFVGYHGHAHCICTDAPVVLVFRRSFVSRASAGEIYALLKIITLLFS